jgi:hypothetical protein
MALNKRLLRKVRNRIAEIPESYRQGTWVSDDQKSPCGTVACLAGETIIAAAPSIEKGIQSLKRAVDRFEHGDTYDSGVVRKARLLLGISIQEATDMFDGYGNTWPSPFGERFTSAQRPATKAKIAVAYLDECLRRGRVTW